MTRKSLEKRSTRARRKANDPAYCLALVSLHRREQHGWYIPWKALPAVSVIHPCPLFMDTIKKRTHKQLTPKQQLIITAPDPVTVQAPDTTELVKTYTAEILPLESYKISTPEEYIQGKLHWKKATDWAKNIDKLFEDACDKAHKAHKALTNLRGQLKGPAEDIAKQIGAEILRFEREEESKRRAEEARQEAERQAAWRAEQAALEAERQRLIAERQKATEALDPWDVPEEAEAPLPAPVILPPPPPVRLESTVPQVIGGPRTVDKPWEARITDPVALLKWILEKPEDRIPVYVDFRAPALNQKCRELGKDVSRVIPGVEAVRNQTLKRS